MSNLSNVPYGNLIYMKINSVARQWMRQFTLALCKELLGLIRSKFSSVPIPGSDLTLNGTDLVTQGREDQTNLMTSLRETLDSLTYAKMIEEEAGSVENMQRILRTIPMPAGKSIIVG